jgi:ribonuclease P protein component
VVGNGFGFSSQLRLKKPVEYQYVFDNPIKSSDQYFTLLAKKNSCQHPRLGLAIAKKSVKKAVCRNSIKRLVRESFRVQQGLGGIDIVVLAKPDAVRVPMAQLRKSLDKHWLRLSFKCS